MLDINERLNNIERRLLDIEIKLGMIAPLNAGPARAAAAGSVAAVSAAAQPPGAAAPGGAAGATRSTAQAAGAAPRTPARAAARQPAEPVSATQLMAWAAGFALLLAAVYFLKLVYDVGWLTPERQIVLAVLAGFALIAGGLFFARIDRAYAAYLPALGLIIVYLAAYTAHLYYHLWSGQTAISAVSAATLIGIWLGRRFDQSAYAVLAATGVYLSPLLMQAAPNQLIDVVIFYSAWSLLFSFCSLVEGRRIVYVLPMFFALIGFDLIWRSAGEANWLLAVLYQLVQFMVFVATAAAFSVVHKRPMGEPEAVVHGLALIYFYGLEYLILHRYAPQVAPLIGLASALAVFLVYLGAKLALKDTQRLGAGALIVSWYCSLVVAHAVFFEMLPQSWFPWAALAMAAGLGVVLARTPARDSAMLVPVYIVAGLIFCLSYLSLLAGGEHGSDIALPHLALALYAAVLYGGYYWFSRAAGGARAAPIILYAGHFAFMEFTLRVLDNGFTLSMVWAAFAVAVLLVAIAGKDKLLGQSALLVFCASGLKVLMHDLAASSSLVRVLTLIVLAASLYLGGWLYQSLVREVSQ
jgi:uncharacterized membrane protein